MNVLLIYPTYPSTFWSLKHSLKFISKKAVHSPLGLLTVGAILPKEWNKKLIDTNVTELKDEDIIWADIVFISAIIHMQRNNTQDIINRCKAQSKTIVVGGPAFTTQHEKYEGIDHFVLNEAEITLPRFLKDLKKGKPKRIYTTTKKADLTKTPIPLWSLINLKDYETIGLQYTRGCPFNCEFCCIIVLDGRVPRTKTPEQMIKEFQSLYDAGWEGTIFMVDDNFIGNKANVKKMLTLLIKWQKEHKYPYRLGAQASVELADDEELMQMMSEANFSKVFLGIETPDIDSLKECGKMQNVTKDLAKKVRIIQQYGMQVMGGIIVGFDNDTEDIFDTQIQFIQQTGIVIASVSILTALPKTRLWHRLKAEGRLLDDSTINSLNDYSNIGDSSCFIPKMGQEKFIQGYKRLISTIYTPKNYYQRLGIFIRNYNPIIRYPKMSKNDIYMFLQSMWKTGILSKVRLLYWKLIIKTFLTKRKALPILIKLTIAWYHYEMFAKDISNIGIIKE